jgi:hypothetical protein
MPSLNLIWNVYVALNSQSSRLSLLNTWIPGLFPHGQLCVHINFKNYIYTYIYVYIYIKKKGAGCQWLLPAILVTQEER